MNQPNLLELAKQGNSEAIASLLNQNLQVNGISIIKSTLKDGCLQLMLASGQLLDREKVVSSIVQQLKSLEVKSIDKVRIYRQNIGEDFPDWTQEVSLQEKQPLQLTVLSNSISQKTENIAVRRNKFLEDLRTFKFSSVVPYQEALSAKLYNSNAVRLLLFFGLFPSAVSLFFREAGLANISWILGIYYASIWGIILYNIIKPAHFSWLDTLKLIFFTSFIGIPILLFFHKIPPFNILYSFLESSDLILRAIGFILGVGVLEEICKGLPVYLFLLRPGKLTEPLSAAFYGAMSGLGFAISEGVEYSVRYALGLRAGGLDFGSYLLINTIRFIPLPLIHAVFAGIVGYFLGLAAINRSRQNAIIFIGVAIASVLHGLYDTFANGIIGLGILVFSILLFVTYLRRSKQMVSELEQAEINYQNQQNDRLF